MSKTQIPALISTPHITTANRYQCDASAKHHKRSDQWSKLALGFAEKTYPFLEAILTDRLMLAGVDGAKLVQIGCNNGRQIVSTFVLGAHNGLRLDQSVQFLQQAKALQAISGHNCQLLCSDVYALPNDIARDFGIGLITIGVLSWMPDLTRFFSIATGLLRPGGRLVIYETHPVLEMFDPHCANPIYLRFHISTRSPILKASPSLMTDEKPPAPEKAIGSPIDSAQS